MKIALRLLGVVLITGLVFLVAGVLATWEPDRPVEKLAARWAGPPSQFLDVGTMRVHLRDEGPRDDPVPIILLHGTADSLHTWEGWAQALKAQRRIVRFDLPAFGLTGPHPQNDYSIEAYTRFVTQVVDAMGIKTFVLAGNSLGGRVAWATAAALPDRVSRLILVDAAGYPQQSISVPIAFRLAKIPVLRDAFAYVLPRGMVQSSVRNVYGDPSRVTPELVDRYFELTLRTGNRVATGKRFEQVTQGDPAQIKALKLPVLILWGAKDRLIPLENAKRFEADIVGSRLVVFDALGHVPQEEDAGATVQEVRKFLSIKQENRL
jgi:pimeloyl-ACP methyl ester carboxylesterase